MRYDGRVIPPDLWTRLRALDRRCDIEMHRLDTAEGGRRCTTGRNYPRMWRVVIRDRVGEEKRAVTCESPRLAEAMGGAVAMAEEYGWSAPVEARRGSDRRD